jgi:hypothetical protein
MRTENKSMLAYAPVVAQGGSKLKQAPPSDCVFDTAPEGCHTFVIGFGHPLETTYEGVLLPGLLDSRV